MAQHEHLKVDSKVESGTEVGFEKVNPQASISNDDQVSLSQAPPEVQSTPVEETLQPPVNLQPDDSSKIDVWTDIVSRADVPSDIQTWDVDDAFSILIEILNTPLATSIPQDVTVAHMLMLLIAFWITTNAIKSMVWLLGAPLRILRNRRLKIASEIVD